MVRVETGEVPFRFLDLEDEIKVTWYVHLVTIS